MLTEVERQNQRTNIRAAANAQQVGPVLEGVRRLMRGSAKLPQDAMFCASALNSIADLQTRDMNARRLKTFIVRSVTLEPLLPFFKTEAALQNLLLDVQWGGYGSYIDELLNPNGELQQSSPDLVIVVLEWEDIAGSLADLCATGRSEAVEAELNRAVERLSHMLSSLRQFSSARIVFQGFTVPDRSSLGDPGDSTLLSSLPRTIEQLNLRTVALCRSIPDCLFFDVDRIAARYGRDIWRDRRMFLASRLPVSGEVFGPYAKALMRAVSALFRAPRKVLCTDLDNTLWGGVLGEDGPQGIATGSAFPGNCYLEYQQYLKQLRSRGILLAAVSKNNETDVEEAFRLRSADLAITLQDFVATKISWQDKADSLRELASELSLGLDAFVFVDDNPVECQAIQQRLPEVAVVTFPVEEPWRVVEMLTGEPFFDALDVTADDLKRTEEYHARAERSALAGGAENREQFLASLDTVCTFVSVEQAPLTRAVQMLAKTNQFNLTTCRHSAAEVLGFTSDHGIALAVRVRDRFGDSGVVGLALASVEGLTCRIDSFLLSCRVIGRGIETALLAEVAARAERLGAWTMVGEYIPTRKNAPCRSFYPDHGFTLADPPAGATPDSVFYKLNLQESVLQSPSWLRLEGVAAREGIIHHELEHHTSLPS